MSDVTKAKRAGVITHDSAGRFAAATAVKWADGSVHLEGSGGELPDGPTPWPKKSIATASPTLLEEMLAGMQLECGAAALTLYPNNLQAHAEADAVALAATL